MRIEIIKKPDFAKIAAFDPQTGKRYICVLDGEDVDKWNEFMLRVCHLAEGLGANPKWHELNWIQTEIETPRTLLGEILEGK